MSSQKKPSKLQLIEHFKQEIRSIIFEQDAIPSVAPAPAQPDPALAQEAPPVATPPIDQQAQPTAQVEYSLEELIAGLNKIRAGKSFDDREVYQQLETMFNSLDPASKSTIKGLIEQIVGIVTPLQTAIDDTALPSEMDTTGGDIMNQQPSAPPANPPLASAQPMPAQMPAAAPAMPPA